MIKKSIFLLLMLLNVVLIAQQTDPKIKEYKTKIRACQKSQAANECQPLYEEYLAYVKEHAPPNEQTHKGILGIAADYSKDVSGSDNAPTRFGDLRDLLKDLPAARQEVQMLAKNFQGSFWFDTQASELNFKQQAADYAIIHLAMHGLLNAENPMSSSLVVTEVGDSIEDDFLHAYELTQMELNAHLVVLSACETGYGKFEQGEGVLSLARAFMYSGTPSLVVSLWQVNDESTATLMEYFYEQLAQGQPKDEALRQAKLKYLEQADGLAGHPAFWAAFIQLGNTDPAKLPQKSGNLIWWVGGAAALLVILLLGRSMLFRKASIS